MSRYVHWYVGPVAFDVLNDAIKFRRESAPEEKVTCVYDTNQGRAHVRRLQQTDRTEQCADRRSARNEVEDLLRTALIESGYSARQADEALALAKSAKSAQTAKSAKSA